MSWKKIGSNLYFYRTIRIGKRVHSEYQGCGPIGELAAEILEFERAKRRQLREADVQDVQTFQDEQRELGLDTFCRKVEDLAQVALLATGHHRHKGEWRRRRMPQSTAPTTSLAVPVTGGSSEWAGDRKPFALATAELTAAADEAKGRQALVEFISLPQNEIQQRLDLARAGDFPSLDWVQRAFAADPTGKLEAIYGRNAAKQIEDALLHRAAGSDEVARVSLLTQIDRLREELAGPDPSPLERVLADRVALSWLGLHTLELQYERASHEMGPRLTEAMERRIGRLNRQFNEACKTLATVRRLAVPAIRMFLADRQVNVLG